MTLLTIAQDIIKETKNPSIPLTIIGNTQNSAVQVLLALTNSIKSLARDYNWQELYRVEDFTGVVDQEGYDLPSDFDRFLDNTFWNKSKRRMCIGPMDSTQWRLLKDSVTGAGALYDYFRIKRNQVEIYPVPTATDDYIFEYITNLIIESDAEVGQTTWLADTDVPVIDEYVLRLDATWRFLKSNGMPYAKEEEIANKAILQRTSVSGGKKTVYHSPRYPYGRVGWPYIVQNV